jgi:tetratricopeptide (TPR) repeat protein
MHADTETIRNTLFKEAREALISGEYNEAIAIYTRAITNNINSKKAYRLRAFAYENLDSPGKALFDYYRALELYPLDKHSRINGHLYDIFEKYNKESIFESIKQLPHEEMLYLLELALDSQTFIGKKFLETKYVPSFLQTTFAIYMGKFLNEVHAYYKLHSGLVDESSETQSLMKSTNRQYT